MRNRDEMVLNLLIQNCDEIEQALDRFNIKSFHDFNNDNVIKRAITMCLISIAETTKLFTDQFRNEHDYINFKVFKAMRNIAAHKYGSVNFEMVWEIINRDIPEYNKLFRKLLAQIK